jgi:pyruvate/2-oxoglutarate dehydrogenase complex dihydrolipoamide acyltransferase (E2) component
VTSARSRRRRLSVRRRLAVATWRPSSDGRIYARMTFDATALLSYVDQTRQRTSEPVTVTHVVGAALGRALRVIPEIRSRVVLGRIVTSETCDIGFAVDIEDGADLAPVKVHRIDEKTPADVARELAPGVRRLKAKDDPGHARSSSIVRHLPWWSLRPTLSAAGLFIGGFGIGMLGQPGFPLGSAFVSNVGTLGLDEAFLAPVPFARIPLYLGVGAVRDAALIVDGAVAVRPQIVLVATADHRLVDGAHAGLAATVLRELLADPWQLDVPMVRAPSTTVLTSTADTPGQP